MGSFKKGSEWQNMCDLKPEGGHPGEYKGEQGGVQREVGQDNQQRQYINTHTHT